MRKLTIEEMKKVSGLVDEIIVDYLGCNSQGKCCIKIYPRGQAPDEGVTKCGSYSWYTFGEL